MRTINYTFDVITSDVQNYELDGKVQPYLVNTGDLNALVDGAKIVPEGVNNYGFPGFKTAGKTTIIFPENAVDGDESTRKRNEVRIYYGIPQDDC